MFKIQSYVTPILLSYVDKYVRDFTSADAQVSLWGGGVALHHLVLTADVLQQELALPFTLVSGRIHELLIHVPWTKIMFELIVVTIDTIECVLSLNPPAASSDGNAPPESARCAPPVEAPPGYMQALVRRVVSNIALRVHHLIVKYVQDDVVLSLNIKHLAIDSAGANWEPAFADVEPARPVLRRLLRLDDLTLCLDRADGDGKVRCYQEPLLYRCRLDFRVATWLVSASTRRARQLSVQLRASHLAWGASGEQLGLLRRLLAERPAARPPPARSVAEEPAVDAAEPARAESWSSWAWSWLPAWGAERAGPARAGLGPAAPVPLYLSARLEHVSLVCKVVAARRARPVLQLTARRAVTRGWLRAPTALRLRLAAADLALTALGDCVCAHRDDDLDARAEATVYLRGAGEPREEWPWPSGEPADGVWPGETALGGGV